MFININGTVFDLLAILCSCLSREEERECAIAFWTANEDGLRDIIEKYSKVMKIVIDSAEEEYIFNDADVAYLNGVLKSIEENITEMKKEIYWLIIQIENGLDKYNSWQNHNPIYQLEPLNHNVEECGIAIYPRISPRWDVSKSERNRVRALNAKFIHYFMIRTIEARPFQIVMHYWNDEGLLKVSDKGWKLQVALSPVMDYAELNTVPDETEERRAVRVEGLKNEGVVTERVLKIFDNMFSDKYGFIVFPEALGTKEIAVQIKKKMRGHPEYHSFVLLPTICENGSNALIVLGPGGVEVLRHEKAAPFILIGEEDVEQIESLDYKKEIHLLMTKELGLVAFVICAELLDPVFYHILTNVAMVDTIICPSFSPGINAFKNTMLKGIAPRIMQIYINTCSAKAVSRSGQVSDELVLVQVPNIERNKENDIPVMYVKRECGGDCKEATCYFDIAIIYQDKQFTIESMHCVCA